MARRIVIDPVTRIEGHAKITVHLDDDDQVSEARFHVAEFRGFEKFCEGRPYTEMAGITSRVCGICPVSHLIASVKAGDAIMAVEIPDNPFTKNIFYLKIRDRSSYAFALVSVAVALDIGNGIINDARL